MTPPAIAKAIAALERIASSIEVKPGVVLLLNTSLETIAKDVSSVLADLKRWAETQESAGEGVGTVAAPSARLTASPSEAGTAAPPVDMTCPEENDMSDIKTIKLTKEERRIILSALRIASEDSSIDGLVDDDPERVEALHKVIDRIESKLK